MLRISETILKTGQLEAMKAWYRLALEVEILFEHDVAPKDGPGDYGGQTRASDLRMCFFRISEDYPFTQMIGLFEEPGTSTMSVKSAPGLHHMQLMVSNFDSLIRKYEYLKSAGLKPHRSTNHGIMTSFYFRDPDGNNVEFTSQNFPTLETMTAFMKGEYFAKNPSGEEIDDPDAFVARYRGGATVAELTTLDA